MNISKSHNIPYDIWHILIPNFQFMKTSITRAYLLLLFCSICLFTTTQTTGGLIFNGSDNFVQINESPFNVIGIGDFTIEAWIKGHESQNTHPMILSTRGNNGSQGRLYFSFMTNGEALNTKCFVFKSMHLTMY